MYERKERTFSEKQDPWGYPKVIADQFTTMEYDGVYLDILTNCNELRCIEAFYTFGKIKEPRVWLLEPHAGEFLLKVHNKDKVGMLADYLGINRREFQDIVRNENIKLITKMLMDQGERKIKLSCSLFQGDYYVHTVATEKHATVKFSEIEDSLKSYYKGYKINTGEIGRSRFWEIPICFFDTEDDQYDVFVRILSGRNILTRGIKVILKLKQNNESEITYSYNVIKHYKEWESKLLNLIDDATRTAFKLKDFVTKLQSIEITKEKAINVIENIIVLSPIDTPYKKDYLRKYFSNAINNSNIENVLDFAILTAKLSDKISIEETTENTPDFFKNKIFEYIIKVVE